MAIENISVIFGENLGFVRSFFKLLELSSPAADYFAFCDQDDIWKPHKISRAVAFLSRSPREMPALYCSRRVVVDENLKALGYSDIPVKGLSFSNALVECPAPGCTQVSNRAARHLMLSELPRYAFGHDWWNYLVTSALGMITYDEEPGILYRKHGSNTIGTAFGTIDAGRIKTRRFRRYGRLRLVTKQAEEFRRIYGPLLAEEQRRVLDRFLESRKGFWERVRYAWGCEVYRQSTPDHFILKLLIVLDRL